MGKKISPLDNRTVSFNKPVGMYNIIFIHEYTRMTLVMDIQILDFNVYFYFNKIHNFLPHKSITGNRLES